jgi:hypothetical protein
MIHSLNLTYRLLSFLIHHWDGMDLEHWNVWYRWLQLEMEKAKNILEMQRQKVARDVAMDVDDATETSQKRMTIGSTVDGGCELLVQEMVLAMKDGDRERLAQLLSKLPIEEAAKLLVEAQEAHAGL